MNALAIALHVLAAIFWIGGMFFAYVVLRPALVNHEPARRLTLWSMVFARFFAWVWGAVLALLLSGYWLVFAAFGGFATSPWYVHLMQLIGLIMIGLFVWLYWVPYAGFRREVAREHWPAAAAFLNRIRRIVAVNLLLGIVLVSAVSAGRYL